MGVGANYYKETKKGTICFLNFDESRFKLLDELKCGLYCESKTSWRLHRLRTKLFCRQCDALIGYVNGDGVHSLVGCSGYDSNSDSNSYGNKRFWVKIRALQPDQEPDENYSPSMTDGKGNNKLALQNILSHFCLRRNLSGMHERFSLMYIFIGSSNVYGAALETAFKVSCYKLRQVTSDFASRLVAPHSANYAALLICHVSLHHP